MSEEKTKILEMLASGKINVAEATQLLKSFEEPNEVKTNKADVKFFRVKVLSKNGEGKDETVNVRIPLQLLRSGIKLASLIPIGLQDKVNLALKEEGLQFDLSKIKTEDLESLVSSLAEMTVDVDQGGEKVQIFCE
jgi:hypothetical protein